MRKEWMEPVIEVQEFVANEYVAACGCIIILRVMVKLMENTLAMDLQNC